MRNALSVLTISALLPFAATGCTRNGPGAPTAFTNASASANAPVAGGFTVSGVVMEFRLGPLEGVTVTARPNSPSSGLANRTTKTDGNGAYRIEGLTAPTIVEVTKDGYWPDGFGAVSGNQVLNFALTRRLPVRAGQSLNTMIWGDSLISGEDWTGSHCDVHDANGVHANGCLVIPVATDRPGSLTARVTWAGGGTEMGVFISTGWFDGTYGRGNAGVAETTLDVAGGETLVVISLERAAGMRPVPANASQSFELTTSFRGR